ncbi:hypothetical protein DOTSEDRAFT_39666 [Dothistroma septosporum NZE10]|uniref:Uncharacterized protein n=1 Tax=Dothistroma septosporum (strain NZE10 / CBS 128990) TaxID=675120 RepID=M2XZM4_DOTSN|nr:hypothetical protein DOTSEDRAFT_39666 [Dothistroma septosporum NZE10]
MRQKRYGHYFTNYSIKLYMLMHVRANDDQWEGPYHAVPEKPNLLLEVLRPIWPTSLPRQRSHSCEHHHTRTAPELPQHMTIAFTSTCSHSQSIGALRIHQHVAESGYLYTTCSDLPLNDDVLRRAWMCTSHWQVKLSTTCAKPERCTSRARRKASRSSHGFARESTPSDTQATHRTIGWRILPPEL